MSKKNVEEILPEVKVVEKSVEKVVSDKIWASIKNVTLEMFALPGQFVYSYFQPKIVEPSKLYLECKVSAALPALEEALNKKFGTEKYLVSKVDRFVVVEIKKQY